MTITRTHALAVIRERIVFALFTKAEQAELIRIAKGE